MEKYYIELGHELRRIRETRNLTLDDVVSQLGITKKSLAFYETGQRKITNPMISRLCEIYDIDIDVFWNRTKDFLKDNDNGNL